MASLFGAQDRLAQLLSQRRQANQQEQRSLADVYANLANNKVQAGWNRTGATFGAAFGQALGEGLFGKPENIQQAEAQAAQEKQVLAEMGAIDMNDPAQLAAIGKRLIEAGELERGFAISQAALDMRQAKQAALLKEEGRAGVANYLGSQGVPESLQVAVNAGVADAGEVIEWTKPKPINQETVGLGRFTLPDGTTVSGGFVKDKQGNAQVRYFNETGQFVPAPAGTLPEANSGTSITFSDKDQFKNMNTLMSSYASDTKPLNEQTDELIRLNTAIKTGIKEDTQAALARLFGNKIRSNRELEEWANVGPIDEVVFNAFNRVISGDYTQENLDTVENLIAETTLEVADKWQRVNDQYTKRAEVGQVPADLVIKSDWGMPNFVGMSKEQIKGLDISTMSSLEKKILKKELIRRAQRGQ